MKSHTSFIQDLRTTDEYVDPSKGWVSSQAVADRITVAFTARPPVTGDHKLPNPHSYNRTMSDVLWGTDIRTQTRSFKGQSYLWQKIMHGNLGSAYRPPLPSNSDAAYNACLEKINNQARASVDLSVDAAEWRQTRKMISGKSIPALLDRAVHVVGLAKKIRRLSTGVMRAKGDKLLELERRLSSSREKRNVGLIKTVANARLEYVYGWKPLIDDLYGTVNSMNRIATDPAFCLIESRATIPSELVTTETYPAPDGVNGQYIVTRKRWDRCEMGLYYSPHSSTTQMAAQFSSLNPVSLAWELLPYSFVVDWFIDVGGYLRNLETGLAFGGSLRTGYQTRTSKTETTVTLRVSGRTKADGTTIDIVARGCSSEIDMSRSVLTSWPLPYLPRPHLDLGSSQLLNAASLLAQFLGRK